MSGCIIVNLTFNISLTYFFTRALYIKHEYSLGNELHFDVVIFRLKNIDETFLLRISKIGIIIKIEKKCDIILPSTDNNNKL